MNHPLHSSVPGRSGPPSKHRQALMIWLAVLPTLTILNLILGRWLHTLAPVRTGSPPVHVRDDTARRAPARGPDVVRADCKDA